MLQFNDIAKRIHAMLRVEGINDFPLRYVKKIITCRNFMFDIMEIYDFDWFPLKYKRKYKWVTTQLQFRADLYNALKEDFKYYKLRPLSENTMDRVFHCERLVLKNVGNILSYYELLEKIKHQKVELIWKFQFNKWTEWSKDIDDAIEYFTYEFGIYPNAFSCNDFTLSQINFIINTVPGERKTIHCIDIETQKETPIPEDEEIELTTISHPDYSIQFYHNEIYKDKEFVLAYLENPIDDDDDDDDDNNDPINPTFTPPPKSKTIPILI